MMSSKPERIPLNTFAIAFGLVGLAVAWTAAVGAFGLPALVDEPFWFIGLVAWVWLIVAHIARGRASGRPLVEQLRHPAQGPIAALVPIMGMLLAAHLHLYLPLVGTVLVVVFAVLTFGYAAWLIAYWMTGALELGAIHGGYFLPTVAGGFLAAEMLAEVGFPALGVAAFGSGLLFWVVIMTLLVARLALRPPLPAPLVPTMAIMVAPPAVAGAAWFAINGGRADVVSLGLAGLTVMMALLQVMLLPRYLRLPFSLGFWSFTFSTAAVVSYAIEWLAIERPAGWQPISCVILALITALVAAIAVRSLVLVAADIRSRRALLERQLVEADDADAGMTTH
jgi:tellurite resistance protein